VDEWKTPRGGVEQRAREDSGLSHPVQVELEVDQRRIELGDEHVVGQLASDRRELEIVVVIRDGQPARAARGRYLVQPRRPAVPLLQRLALALGHPREHQVLGAERERLVDRARRVVSKATPVDMRADGREVQLGEQAAHLGGIATEQPRKLDLAIAHLGEAPQRALEVRLHRGAHGVELHADRAEAALSR
jgi:hypothetical protein